MFKTLDDYKKVQKQTNKDDKNTNSYAGGAKSGMEVENPNDIDKLVNIAEQQGKQESQKGKPETNCKISLYENGFTIDDGQLRLYDAPENKLFMSELTNRVVPTELRNKYPNGLAVGMEDRRSEKYRLPTPPKYIAFSGEGTKMGEQMVQKNIGEVNVNNAQKIQIDENKQKTSIQIRLHNGKTTQIDVNLDSKVQVLFDYVQSVAPVQGEFKLLSGFPPKPLINKNQSIEEADLIDASIKQQI